MGLNIKRHLYGSGAAGVCLSVCLSVCRGTLRIAYRASRPPRGPRGGPIAPAARRVSRLHRFFLFCVCSLLNKPTAPKNGAHMYTTRVTAAVDRKAHVFILARAPHTHKPKASEATPQTLASGLETINAHIDRADAARTQTNTVHGGLRGFTCVCD